MTTDSTNDAPRRGRGCLWGCGGCLGILVASVCVIAAGILILRALRPDPEKLYAGASDPVAEAAIENVLINAGVQGAQVTVIPTKGGDDQLAYIVLDESSGFSADNLAQGGDAGLANALLQLDSANKAQELNIGPVAMEYRDQSGEPLFVVATDQENIQAFASGEISREELLAGTEIDLTNLLGGIDALSESTGN